MTSARLNMLGRLTGLDIDPGERERIVDAVITEARSGSLDEAWEQLETALPAGWWVQLDHSDGSEYRAAVGERKWSADYQRLEARAGSPVAALQALADKLRAVS